jgi:hypothetical protein
MKTRAKTNTRSREHSKAKDLTTRQATGVRGGLLPAVNQLAAVPAVQMGDGSVRKLTAAQKV